MSKSYAVCSDIEKYFKFSSVGGYVEPQNTKDLRSLCLFKSDDNFVSSRRKSSSSTPRTVFFTTHGTTTQLRLTEVELQKLFPGCAIITMS